MCLPTDFQRLQGYVQYYLDKQERDRKQRETAFEETLDRGRELIQTTLAEEKVEKKTKLY